MTSPESFDAFVESLRLVFFALRAISSEVGADVDCNPVERGVLKEVDDQGPQTVPALAHTRAVSRQAMQKTADHLVARGLLRMDPNPRHQRSMLFALTPAGKKLLLQILARERRLLSRSELPVNEPELQRATRTLQELARYFSSPAFVRPSRFRRGGSR